MRPLSKNTLLIGYKLLSDLLFLFLFFFILALIADGLIPGIISSHISFLKIIFILSLNLMALYTVGYAADIKLTNPILSNKKTTVFLTVLGALIIFNSLFKLNPYLALFILLFALGCKFFLYRLIFEK